MRRDLPSLSALRAFEAAARHESITRGAAELGVTQAAVSHQVRALEDELGLRLFRRLPRRLALTSEGDALLRAVREAFDAIESATARVRGRETSGILTVSVLPSFAARWLVPRLGRFRDRYPEIDVRIAPSSALADFARDDVDLAIRFGSGRYLGLHVEHLLDEESFPVCAPALRRRRSHPLRRPEDLRRHVLLHDSDTRDAWRDWLAAAGVRGVDAERGPIFHDASMMLQAAAAGQGVALGRRVLVADDLRARRLVRAFERALPSPFAYWIVCRPEDAKRPKVAAFRRWLAAEAKRRGPRPRARRVPATSR